jgi:ubiquinol-cytochrome c reductase cytochrome b subunit
VAAVAWGTLTHLGKTAPWSPVMDAWSALPVPEKFLVQATPVERQGSLVFQLKQCRNCHALGDAGGHRGPALDDVATRLTRDQLIRQVLQGGGNMPAYGTNLSPAETTALVAFLEMLRPGHVPPARDAAARAAASAERR